MLFIGLISSAVGLVRRGPAVAGLDRPYDPHREISAFQSTAAPSVVLLTFAIMAIGIAIPFSPLGAAVGLQPLPLAYFPWLAGILLAYCVTHPDGENRLQAPIQVSGCEEEASQNSNKSFRTGRQLTLRSRSTIRRRQ